MLCYIHAGESREMPDTQKMAPLCHFDEKGKTHAHTHMHTHTHIITKGKQANRP